MTRIPKTWLVGFYSGVGDIICAHPWICSAALQNPEILIDIAASGGALEIAGSLRWPQNIHFVEFSFPKLSSLGSFTKFLLSIFIRKYERVLNSPHPPKTDSSWKIPLLLLTLKAFRRVRITEGAADDPFSRTYTYRYPINRNTILGLRDKYFFEKAEIIKGSKTDIGPYLIRKAFNKPKDIGIHVGSSLSKKMWPASHVISFIEEFHSRNSSYKIVLFGLSSELSPYKHLADRPYIELFEGQLDATFKRFLTVRAAVTVDSGFMHVAASAKIPQVALFGSTKVAPHKPLNEEATILFKKQYPCQPCESSICKFGRNYCMESIKPVEVVNALEDILRHE